jgi:hypothetical protein
MPKTSIHKDNESIPWKRQIDFDSLYAMVLTVPETLPPNLPAKTDFNPGVSPPNSCHQATALFRADAIHLPSYAPTLMDPCVFRRVIFPTEIPAFSANFRIIGSTMLAAVRFSFSAISWSVPS